MCGLCYKICKFVGPSCSSDDLSGGPVCDGDINEPLMSGGPVSDGDINEPMTM